MTLPEGFRMQAVRMEDATDVMQLVDTVCRMEGDPVGNGMTLDEKHAQWRETAGFDLATDAWVVRDPSGRLIGYEEVVDRGGHAYLTGDGYVHPEFAGRGIGTALLRRMEARAREHIPLADPGVRVFVRNFMGAADRSAADLHVNEGYAPVRYFWHMEIAMDAPPEAPAWPAGIALRPFDVARDNRRLFEATDEAFQDHWSHIPMDFATWNARRIEVDSFDPDLYHIAWDGDQIAGFALCRYRGPMAWVSVLGVRRPWRRRGLGLALLRHAFADFHRRGERQAGLSVDAASTTGAMRLYERAGMHAARTYVAYEKELRPGREYTGG